MEFDEYYKKFGAGKNSFYIYILQLSDGKFYIGQTHNLERRLSQHFNKDGVQITKDNPPIKVICTEKYKTRDEALKREMELMIEYEHLLSK